MHIKQNADALFCTQQRQWPTLREMGHRGAALQAFRWDGPANDSQTKRWQQYFKYKAPTFCTVEWLTDPEILELLEVPNSKCKCALDLCRGSADYICTGAQCS